MPKVSVIIPVYNVEKYLRECLDSVVNQTLKDIEIICVNDGSTDNSRAILDEYASKDNRIIIINQEKQGVSVARNNGLKRISGEYYLFLDSDDWLDLSTIEIIYNQITADGSDLLLYNYFDCFGPKYVEYKLQKGIKNIEPFYFNECIDDFFYSHTGIMSKLYRNIDDGIIFHSELVFGEDTVYFWEKLLNNPKITVYNKALYYYRQHYNSTMHNNSLILNNKLLESINYLQNKESYQILSQYYKAHILDRFLLSICYQIDNLQVEKITKKYITEIDNFLYSFKSFDNEVLKSLRYFRKTKDKVNSIKKYKIKKRLRFLLSVYNENTHKILCILGLKFKFKIKFNEPIDLVYCWVDGSDTEWRKEKQYWQEKEGIQGYEINDCRFVDNQELKYSLRSVAKNAPWINHIYIITNGQIPKWLDTSHPKITVVDQKEIMPSDALPTYNASAIETCIANIPNLSEYFLYANDDFFINKPVTPDFFFDKKGRPIIRLVKQNWSEELINQNIYIDNVVYSINLIKNKYKKYYKYESSHNITPYRKSYYLTCKEEFKSDYEKTCYARFRAKNCIQRTIVSFWTLANNLGKLIVDRSGEIEKGAKTQYFTISNPSVLKQKIKEYNPTLFCINDNENAKQENRIRLKSLLWELFPNVQPWEKPNNYQIKPAFDDENSINIVFCPDNNYVKYFGVLLQSVIDNANPNKNYDIIIFETDIISNNKKRLLKMLPKNFSLRFFDVTEFISENFKNLKISAKNYWSVATFYRLFIPFIMQDYNKVLYLDSDMCTDHNIDELFDIKIKEKELLAIKDTASPILYAHKNRYNYIKNILNLSNPELYFNAGCVLFNLCNIKIESYKAKLLKTFEINDLWFLDQDIINMVFENKTELIHNKWNFMMDGLVCNNNFIAMISGEYKKNYIEARENPYIIHYSGSEKPWKNPSEEHADIFWHYARKTPFYEEIIYENTRLSSKANSDAVKYSIKRKKLYLNYLRCKLLAMITFGKKRKHYINKRNILHERVRIARKFLK